ncbi:MAG: hypothetical protein L6R37_008455, partial [Teloschistes peruensis]
APAPRSRPIDIEDEEDSDSMDEEEEESLYQELRLRRKNKRRSLRQKVLRLRDEDSDVAGRRNRLDDTGAAGRRCREEDVIEEDRPRVSFLHDLTGKVIPNVLKSFPSVGKKMLTKMFHSQFSVEDLPKLHTYVLKTSATELKDFAQLMRSFEVYGQIICAFTHENNEMAIQQALADYRMRLYKLQETYTFPSIRDYHLAFVQTRIIESEDLPLPWKTPDPELLYRLVPKAQPGAHQTTPYKPGELGKTKKPTPCWAWNGTGCEDVDCAYLHVCLNCNQPGHTQSACPSPARSGASGANNLPLRERVSRP